MRIAKGLIIADPWIGYILDGRKTWEMRSTETSVRGPFALIRKGAGAVWGIATLVDVGRSLTPSEMLTSFDKHKIPPDMIRSGQVAKWNTPWILTDIRSLPMPVPYSHPSGAVTWVNLAEDVSQAIAGQLRETPNASPLGPQSKPISAYVESASKRDGQPESDVDAGRLVAQAELTEGNIKNNHFYLRGYIHHFPTDLLGGSNKDAKASQEAVIDWGGPSPAVTDIDGEKQFFRARSWIKRFFEATGARPGDSVFVEEEGPYRYKISLKKA
jgi:hypothetical protein